MATISSTTRFADLSHRQALFVVSAAAAVIIWCLIALFTPPRTDEFVPADGSDLRLYRRIVDRVHAGENYYDAAGREMRAARYPTGSIFNWRPPVYAWLFGLLPTPTWAQAILATLALVTMILACAVMGREGGIGRVAVGFVPLFGALQWSIDGDAFLCQELWSGILVALSICAYARERWLLGLVTGLSALLFRELALPYCLIALLLAWRQRRRAEVMLWLLGLALYGVGMVFHFMAAADRILPTDRVHGGWIQWGGTPFLLLTCRMNAYLFNAPLWVSAIYLPLVLLGLAGWRGWIGTRLALTAGAYVAAFAVVGLPFNDYWGLMYAPILAFGFAAVPDALRDLSATIRRG